MIGVLLDLRGIFASISTASQYVSLFELMYLLLFYYFYRVPFFPLFQNMALVRITTLDLLSPLLKFISEFCSNKQNRIRFQTYSANGIILFKQVSLVITNFGSSLLAFKYSEDPVYLFIY